MMPSGSSTSRTDAGNDGNDDQVTAAATSTQWLPLIMCHEAAITLNNYIVTTLLWRDRDIRAASATCRDAIYLIKKCTTPLWTDGDTTDEVNAICPEEIHDIVQRALGPVTAAPSISSMEVQEESGSFQNETDRHLRIQVISNCLPCSNVVIPSRYTTTTTTATTATRTNASVITPTVRAATSRSAIVTNGHNVKTSATSDVSMLPNTSNHSIVSTSTVSSSSGSDSHPTASVASRAVPRPSSTHNEATTTPDGSADDGRIPMSVCPMTIDDFHVRCTRPELNDDDDGDARSEQHQQLVEYHAAILLYNFGIIHQCLGMMMIMDNDDADMIVVDANETIHHATSTSDNHTSRTGPHHMNDDHHDPHSNDGESAGQLLASYKILTNTLSWVHELVRPILDHVMNEDRDSVLNTNDTEIPLSIATLSIDHYYMNKYLHLMVRINHHVVSIIDMLHLPDGSQDYFCQMMNEILNFISFLDIFYPTTSHDQDHHTGRGGSGTNTGGSASPAA
jgi:hypothetical protein